MIAVLPANTEHTIQIIPRYTPADIVSFDLYNEATKVETNQAVILAYTNGNLFITFDFTFAENDKYQIKITDTNGVVFRGKLIATSQTPQDFKQSKDLYYYE